MRLMHTLAKTCLFSTMLTTAVCAHANTWQALSGKAVTNASPRGAPYYEPSQTSEWVSGGDYFEDGKPSPSVTTPILVDPDPALNAYSLSFEDCPNCAPPQVDLEHMRADFSSLVWRGWDEDGNQRVGGSFSHPGWIDITALADGTYQAVWNYTYSGVFSERYGGTWGGVFTLVFAPAVPEPTRVTYLLGGLCFLAQLKRRANRA